MVLFKNKNHEEYSSKLNEVNKKIHEREKLELENKIIESKNIEEINEVNNKSLLEKINLPELIEVKKMQKTENLPKLNENEINAISEKITSTFKESLLSDSSALDDSQKLKDVETVKVIINELLGVKKHLPSTTNLTKNQVHGISKLKTINLIFKSPLIDEYAFNIMELKRSETAEPFSMLKGFFDLANSSQRMENQEASSIDRILGRKGK